MRILIVEDDVEAAGYLAKALREAGHVVDHAADGEAGYDLAASAPYDILVVDRMLPKRDGLSMISTMSISSPWSRTSLVVCRRWKQSALDSRLRVSGSAKSTTS